MSGLWLVLAMVACEDKAPCNSSWEGYELGDSAVYVDVSADPGGDGQRCSPFTRIADALSATDNGGMIAVGGGTYTENLVIENIEERLRLVGHGRDEVVIDGSEGEDDESTVLVSGSDDVVITGVTITGGPYVGLVIEGSGVEMAEVAVTQNYWKGIAVSDASDVTMDDVEITGNLPVEAAAGWGMSVRGGANVTGTAVRIMDNTETGLGVAELGTTLELSVSEISRTGSTFTEGYEYAYGLLIFDGATVNLNAGTLLEDNVDVSIALAWGAVEGEPEPPTLTLDDVSILSTLSVPNGDYVEAIGIYNWGGVLNISDHVLIAGSLQGLFIDGTYGATATISGLTVEGIEGATWGVGVGEGATATVHGSDISGSFMAGVFAYGRGTSVMLDDTSVWACSQADGQTCNAVSATYNADLTMVGGEIASTAGLGILVSESASLAAEGVEIHDSRPVPLSSGAWGGGGAFVSTGGHLTLDACVLSANSTVAAGASNGGTLRVLNGTEIRDTLSYDDFGAFGLVAQSDDASETTIEAYGGAIDGTEGTGALAAGVGASIVLHGVDILSTLHATLHADESSSAVAARQGGEIYLYNVDVTNQADVGIYVDGTSADGTLFESTVIAVNTVIVDVYSTGDSPAVGIYVGSDGAFGGEMDIHGVEGPALYGMDGLIYCSGCNLSEFEFAGGAAQGGSVLVLEDSDLDATGADYGVWLNSSFSKNALVVKEGTTITGPSIAAISINGDGYYVIQDSELGVASGLESRGTTLNGNAIFASGVQEPWDEDTGEGDSGSGLHIAGNNIHDNAGPAVLLLGATATIGCNDWSGNLVDLAWQSPELAAEPNFVDCSTDDLAVDFAPSPSYAYIDPDLVEFVFDQQLTLPAFE